MSAPAVTLGGIGAGSDGAQVWRSLAEAQLITTVYRGGDPGNGVDPHALGAVLARVDEHAPIGATLSVCVQLASCLPLLATGGEPARELLSEVTGNGAVVALAATDDTAGSDLTALNTELMIDGESLRVTGTKRWITNATHAAAFLVLARTGPGRHFTSFTWVLVPAGEPGVQVIPADTDLFDGSGTGHVRFDQVRLSRAYLVGRVGRGLGTFAAHIAVERLAGALWGVALCRRVLADTKRRLQARVYHDETLWHSSSVRQRFGRCLVLVKQLDALTVQLGEAVTARRDTTAAAVLKVGAAETVERVLDECAHLQGADGFSPAGAQRLRAQAGLWGIGGGVTELVLETVADSADTVLAALAGGPPPAPARVR
ncbi:acyl-CoA dehydrogenase family protein [Actinoplanes sp. HUAS TT8]|uniref:acyl-CoA dehydrogenase family protein n=1 Tax=Actinoplanes sp. HUAS TT8 TaxID=3447453 RepID=UPI003F523337